MKQKKTSDMRIEHVLLAARRIGCEHASLVARIQHWAILLLVGRVLVAMSP